VRRRQFITLPGGAAATWPDMVRAQQPAMPVVAFLTSRAPGATPHLVAAVRQGLRDTGFIKGQNVAIEYRFADNQNDRLPALAADLIRRQVAVIAAFSDLRGARRQGSNHDHSNCLRGRLRSGSSGSCCWRSAWWRR
jgi:hypothetical protein